MKLNPYLLTPTAVLVCSSTVCFYLTAIVGVWAAYDLLIALQRFGLITSGLVLMFGVAWLGRSHAKTVLGRVSIICTVLSAGLTVASLLRLTANSDMVASALSVLLPLGASGVIWQYLRGRRQITYVTGMAWTIGFFGLISSRERTAWLGLIAGMAYATWIYWRYTRLRSRVFQQLADLISATLVIAGVALYIAILSNPSLDVHLSWLALSDSDRNRLQLWRESLGLIEDYRFTGSGLGSTAMIFSTYVYLLHVPFYYHAHNLYLQIALEHGLPGLIAFLGICIPLGLSLSQSFEIAGPYSRVFVLSTLVSIATVFVSGALDASLLASGLMPLLLMPFGFAFALHWALQRRLAFPTHEHYSMKSKNQPRFLRGAAGLLPILLITGCLLWPGSLAHMYANWGAITQSQAELSRFQRSGWMIQDDLRMETSRGIAEAMNYYETALIYNPDSGTAHRRLGQIALSRGDMTSAHKHLMRAYEIAPHLRAPRQLLGEIFALNGDFAKAAALWQTISVEHGQLQLRRSWYLQNGARQQAERLSRAMARVQ